MQRSFTLKYTNNQDGLSAFLKEYFFIVDQTQEQCSAVKKL